MYEDLLGGPIVELYSLVVPAVSCGRMVKGRQMHSQRG